MSRFFFHMITLWDVGQKQCINWYLVAFFQPNPKYFNIPQTIILTVMAQKWWRTIQNTPPQDSPLACWEKCPFWCTFYRVLCVLCTGNRKQPVSNECVLKQPVQKYGNGNNAIKQPLLNTVDVSGSRKYTSKHKPPYVFNIAPCSLYLSEMCFLLKLEARS